MQAFHGVGATFHEVSELSFSQTTHVPSAFPKNLSATQLRFHVCSCERATSPHRQDAKTNGLVRARDRMTGRLSDKSELYTVCCCVSGWKGMK